MKSFRKTLPLKLLLFIVIILPYVGAVVEKQWFDAQLKMVENASVIIVNKQTMKLQVIDYKGNEVFCCGVTTGKNYGNKRQAGDCKTPEGVFHIEDVQNASTWTHDYGDGKGSISGVYGPWFLRLYTPGFTGIGIHGTHRPELIGTRDSEGCIRLDNENIETLKQLVKPGSTVIVLPGDGDVVSDLCTDRKLDSLVNVLNMTSKDVRHKKQGNKEKKNVKSVVQLGEKRTGKVK